MAKGDVKVLGAWPSPFVMRARIALNLKSVEYEFSVENLGSKSELLLKSNPVHKKIPVLINGDKPVCESLIIVEYVDEVWSSGPSILPSDPYKRAVERFWSTYVDQKNVKMNREEHDKNLSQITMDSVQNFALADETLSVILKWVPTLKGIAGAEGEEAKKAAIEQVKEGLVLLEDAYTECSQGKPFFGGNQIGLIDIAFGSFLGWMRVSEKMNQVKLLDEAKTPGLVKWANTFCADAAVKDVMPETDKLVEFAKFLAKLKAAPPK